MPCCFAPPDPPASHHRRAAPHSPPTHHHPDPPGPSFLPTLTQSLQLAWASRRGDLARLSVRETGGAVSALRQNQPQLVRHLLHLKRSRAQQGKRAGHREREERERGRAAPEDTTRQVRTVNASSSLPPALSRFRAPSLSASHPPCTRTGGGGRAPRAAAARPRSTFGSWRTRSPRRRPRASGQRR